MILQLSVDVRLAGRQHRLEGVIWLGLTASNVVAGYRGRPVVQDVSCAIEPGVVTGLVGPNGAGKSTLVRVLVGAMRPMSGRVELDGVAIGRVGVHERAARVALIPQVSGEGRSFSAIQAVRLGRLSMRESAARSDVMARAALERVGLADRGGEALGTLSVGQQQRVMVARALAQLGLAESGTIVAMEPTRFMLADEPVASMDPKHALETMAILKSAAQRGVGVLVVLHDFALAARFADRIVLMDGRGRVAAAGATDEVLTPGTLEGVFGTGFESVQVAGGRFVMAVGGSD